MPKKDIAISSRDLNHNNWFDDKQTWISTDHYFVHSIIEDTQENWKRVIVALRIAGQKSNIGKQLNVTTKQRYAWVSKQVSGNNFDWMTKNRERLATAIESYLDNINIQQEDDNQDVEPEAVTFQKPPPGTLWKGTKSDFHEMMKNGHPNLNHSGFDRDYWLYKNLNPKNYESSWQFLKKCFELHSFPSDAVILLEQGIANDKKRVDCIVLFCDKQDNKANVKRAFLIETKHTIRTKKEAYACLAQVDEYKSILLGYDDIFTNSGRYWKDEEDSRVYLHRTYVIVTTAKGKTVLSDAIKEKNISPYVSVYDKPDFVVENMSRCQRSRDKLWPQQKNELLDIAQRIVRQRP